MNSKEIKTVYEKLETSATLWKWVGILQIIFGFWYFAPILLGIWNIKNASNKKKLTAQFRANPAGMVDTIKAWKNRVIGFGVLNVFLGALIGVVGSIYDYTIIAYVERKENQLRDAGA